MQGVQSFYAEGKTSTHPVITACLNNNRTETGGECGGSCSHFGGRSSLSTASVDSEAAMANQMLIRDPSLQRLVQDFDAVADLVQKLVNNERPPRRHEAIPNHEMEFTTEWQMEPTSEVVYSG